MLLMLTMSWSSRFTRILIVYSRGRILRATRFILPLKNARIRALFISLLGEMHSDVREAFAFFDHQLFSHA